MHLDAEPSELLQRTFRGWRKGSQDIDSKPQSERSRMEGIKLRPPKNAVMPALAKSYTVIAPDLRDLGGSSKPLTGYDGKTVAEDIHRLITRLPFKQISSRP